MSYSVTTPPQSLSLAGLLFVVSLVIPSVLAAQESNAEPAREALSKLADAFGGEMQIGCMAFSVEGTIAAEISLGAGTYRVNFKDGKYLVFMNYDGRESKEGFDGKYYWILDEHRALQSRNGKLHSELMRMLAMPGTL